MKRLLLGFLVVLTIVACNPKPSEQNTENQAPSVEAISLENMDTLVRPQDDFYMYVNGNWMKNTKIPSDRSRWGSFDQLRENTDSVSLSLLKNSLSQAHEKGSEAQKVSNLYASIVDTVARNAAGIQPIAPQLATIDSLKSIAEVTKYLTQYTPNGYNDFYGFYVRPHMKNSSQNAVYLSDVSLGMNRDYYQKEDKESQDKLSDYQNYVASLFKYLKEENPEEKAKNVVDFEKSMAKTLLTFEELREDEKQYNPVAVTDLAQLSSEIDLGQFLQDLKVETDTVIIGELAYFKALPTFFKEDNLAVIKDFLKMNLLNGTMSLLSTDLEQMKFNFYSKKLRGIEEMRSLDKRALSVINRNIGEAFGKMYVKEVFPEEAKVKAEEMIRYLRKSFSNHIKGLSWMTDSTKIQALEKLDNFNVKIGYPDKWKDYSELEILSKEDGGDYFKNMEKIGLWRYNEMLKKVGEKVDKSEWFMPPQMVNAYYSSSFNEIVFPAAILQPPFYNFAADAAVNFGGIGAVIGHEISHGFDDSGAKYDGSGNLNNWWKDEDETAFSFLGTSLANQYDAYEPLPGIFVNGKATLGENIADLGGVNVSYSALQMYLKDNGTPDLIQGFTPDQRFFISWATIWQTKSKDEAIKNQVKSDFHSPGYYRANGPLENVEAFYSAFDVKEGDGMYKAKDKRIVIW